MSLHHLPSHHRAIALRRIAAILADNDHYQDLKNHRDDLEDKMDDIESNAEAEAIEQGFDDEETENMTKGNTRVGGAPC